MEDYFFVSLCISIAVLILLKYSKLPNKFNYYLSNLAIVSWLIPYSFLAKLVPETALKQPLILAIYSTNSPQTVISHTQSNSVYDYYFLILFQLLIAIGVLILVKNILHFYRWKKQIISDPSFNVSRHLSTRYSAPVYTSEHINNGLTLGLFNPVIVVSNAISTSKYIDLIIAHEKQHLACKDNLKLFILEVTECLFWWNPIVKKLVNYNRLFIEVNCDERASITYGIDNYTEKLADLILLNHQTITQPVPTVISTNKHNIYRVKRLKEKRKMTYKNKLICSLIIILSSALVSWNTLATATKDNNEVSQQLGAFIEIDMLISNQLQGDEQDTYQNKISLWTNFDEQVSFKTNDELSINLKAIDLGESVRLEYELIELQKGHQTVVESPELLVTFGKEAVVEIRNPDISEYSYYISAITSKKLNPSLN